MPPSAEYDGANALQRRYVHGPGADGPLVQYDGSGTTDRRWLHADERGSIVPVSDAAGNMLTINRYDEYGIPSSTNAGRFQYTGQMWLPELGLYHYKARAYSPTLGRFLQTDPTGYDGGVNWYAYVGNDPVNVSDPTGEDSGCPSGIVMLCTVAEAISTEVEQPNSTTLQAVSLIAGFTPVGTVLDAATLVLGEDPITGEKVSMAVALAGLIPGVSEGRKGAKGLNSAVRLVSLKQSLLGRAADPRVRNVSNELYRSNAKIGRGSSMDAFRHEGSHRLKLIERRTQLMRLYRDPKVSSQDRTVIRDLLKDIEGALIGK